MKVILLENVLKVGKKDQIVEVSQGYANNCLFKQKLAVEATKTNLKKLKKELDNRTKIYEEEINVAKKLKKELENKEYVFTLKQGVNGNVFGSISNKQINQALLRDGYKIPKHAIIGDPIAHLGYDKVKLQLHKEVICELVIKVEGK